MTTHKTKKKRAPTSQRGETHSRAKLTWAKVNEMRDLRKSEATWSYAKLAKKFRVSTATACRVCTHIGWR